MAFALATARVFIEPDTSKFGVLTERGINRSGVAKSGKRHGRDWGGLFSRAAGAAIAAGGAIYVGKKLLDAATESQKVTAQTNAVIKSTGGTARVTASQVANLAGAISRKTGIDDEAVQAGQNMLLTFRNVRNEAGKGNDIFNQASSTLVDMTSALHGGDVSAENLRKQSIQLGKALNDPVAGLTALRRVGVSFTDQQTKQITKLTESGHKLQAQKIILAELNKEFKGSAAAQATAMDKFKVAFENFQEVIGGVLLQALNAILPPLTVIANWFIGAPKPIQNTVIALALAAGAIMALRKAMIAFGVASKIASLTNPWFLLAAAIITVAAIVILNWDKVKRFFVAAGRIIGDALKTVFGWIKRNWPLLLTILAGPVGLAVAMIIKHWRGVVGFFKGAFNIIKGIITGAWHVILAVTRTVFGAIRAYFSFWWRGIRVVFSGAWHLLVRGLSGAWHTISAVARTVWNGLKGFFTGWWNNFRNGVMTVVHLLQRGLSTSWHAIKDTALSVFTAMKRGIGRIWEGIKSVAAGPVNWILDHVWNPFAGLVNKVLGFFGMKFRLPKHAGGGPALAPGARQMQLAGFATGGVPFDGYVRGPGGPRQDRVGPVLLSNREYVMQASSVDKYGTGFMEAVNKGLLPGMQGGGLPPGAAARFGPIARGSTVEVNLAGLGRKLIAGLATPLVRPIVHGLESAVEGATPNTGWGNLIQSIMVKPLEAFLDWVKNKDATLAGPRVPFYDSNFNAHLRDIMYPYFGHPGWGSYDNPHQVMVPFAGHRVQVHKVVAGMIRSIGAEVARKAPGYVNTIGGYRRGPDSDITGYGLHHWGLAVDINAAENMPNAAGYSMPDSVIRAFGASKTRLDKPGWGWGGLFSGYRDYMHFFFEGGTGGGRGGGGPLRGSYSVPQMGNLWILAGGPRGISHLMGAIGMAESGGNPKAHNPSGASGLWQILGLPFPGNPFIPMTNARMAVSKWRSQGLGAWEAYTNGNYRQFMAGGGSITEPVLGIGMRSGRGYALGERGEETVVPGRFTTKGTEARLDALTAVVADLPGMIGAAVADALDGVSKRGAYRGAYSAR
jgi:hypothetical protein